MSAEAPQPNIANTPEEMEQLVQNALGRLTIYRMKAWFTPEPSHLEWFIHNVMEGKL